MADENQQKRSPNFSAADALLLCEVMGEGSGVAEMSCHTYLRHKFTSSITSSSKKELWKRIHLNFDSKADVPRDIPSLMKKWDNLVQTNRATYSDYMRSQQMTGGGPCNRKLSVLTEAVMAVIGKNSLSTTGFVGESLDSSMISINKLNSNSSNEGTTSSSDGRKVPDGDAALRARHGTLSSGLGGSLQANDANSRYL